MLDLKREGLTRGAVLAGYLEGAAIERVTRIDDGHGLDWILAAPAAWGIKKISRSTASVPSPARRLAGPPRRFAGPRGAAGLQFQATLAAGRPDRILHELRELPAALAAEARPEAR